jgi:hypothetical protein
MKLAYKICVMEDTPEDKVEEKSTNMIKKMAMNERQNRIICSQQHNGTKRRVGEESSNSEEVIKKRRKETFDNLSPEAVAELEIKRNDPIHIAESKVKSKAYEASLCARRPMVLSKALVYDDRGRGSSVGRKRDPGGGSRCGGSCRVES